MKIAANLVPVSILAAGIVGLAACGGNTLETSDLKVTNGKPISEDVYPEVLMLEISTPSGKPGICTGTFVSDSIVVTAAHCVNNGEPDEDGMVDMEIHYVQAGPARNLEKKTRLAKAMKAYQNKAWKATGGGVNATDLGIVVFPAGTAKHWAKISSRKPQIGDDFVIVGYGLNELLDWGAEAGVKRMGKNKIKTVEAGFIQFEGTPRNLDADGVNSASASGDSGGPLFVNGELIGATSGGGVRGNVKASKYVDLTTESSREFLKRFVDL